MSRQTSRGEASVALVCETFGISRAAWYAARKPAVPSIAMKHSPRPRGIPVADLVHAIEAVVAEHRAWGVRKVRWTRSVACASGSCHAVRQQRSSCSRRAAWQRATWPAAAALWPRFATAASPSCCSLGATETRAS